jgi:uncharacterized protein
MRKPQHITTCLLAGTAAAALLLTGCTSDSKTDGKGEVTVVGTGEVQGTPDVMNASVGIEATAKDVSGAVSAMNERAQAMIDALGGAGVAKEDIKTSELSIQPEYSNPGQAGGTAVISGYKATNTVRIVVRDLSKASEILDKAVKAGGDNARLGNISFDIKDDTELLKQARERAFNDAKSRAEQYAQLSGESLGSVIVISEVGGNTPSPSPLSQEKSVADFAIEPGQQTVSFQVTVKWGLN